MRRRRIGLRPRIAIVAAIAVGLALMIGASVLLTLLRSRLDGAATTAATLRARDVASLALIHRSGWAVVRGGFFRWGWRVGWLPAGRVARGAVCGGVARPAVFVVRLVVWCRAWFGGTVGSVVR